MANAAGLRSTRCHIVVYSFVVDVDVDVAVVDADVDDDDI